MAEWNLRSGDKIRASWSEDVRLKSGGKVYVSTAIETTVNGGPSATELKRLTELMETAHTRNIAAAVNDE